MKVKLQRTALLATLGKVKLAVSKKGSLPILSSVLLEAKGRTVAVIGTNLEIAIFGECKATVAKAGSIVVEAESLEALLKASTADTISLAGEVKTKRWTYERQQWNPETKELDTVKEPRTSHEARLKIQAGNTSSTLEANPKADFPPVPKPKGRRRITIAGLGKAIEQVAHAICTDEARPPVLSGVCLTPKRGKLELAAADGFRLAVTSVKTTGKLPQAVIVPRLAALVIKKLMPNKIVVIPDKDGKEMAVEGDGVTMLLRPVQGTFPNYAQLIPKKGRFLTVRADDLRQALKTIMAIKPTNDIVRLLTKGGKLTMTARDGEKVSEVTVPAQGRIKWAMNGKYLKNLLDCVDGTFILKTNSPSEPGVLKSNGTVHVTMPMSVQW